MRKRKLAVAWREAVCPRAVLCLCFAAVVWALWKMIGCAFFGASGYNSYTLQALAWREGRLSLGRDYPWLELAVYNGDWYVSFPPVPSLPLYLLTFFFGAQTPDALLVKLYALGAELAIYALLTRRGAKPWQAVFLALFSTLGGSMLPLIMDGAVWYQAQTLAFFLTTLAICLAAANRMTPALLFYALAVGCRPFNVCYGPLLIILWYLRRKDRSLKACARELWPGIVLGLMVALAYALYNYARFGNPLEFGHNYLPEFMRSQHGQFSLTYLLANARRFLIGLPLRHTAEGWQFEKFGASVFLSNPMLLLLLIWYARDLLLRRTDARAHWTMLFFAVHLFLLLLHRTGGGFQLGARYAVDLVPYSLIYWARRKGEKHLRVWEMALLGVGGVLAFLGSVAIHI